MGFTPSASPSPIFPIFRERRIHENVRMGGNEFISFSRKIFPRKEMSRNSLGAIQLSLTAAQLNHTWTIHIKQGYPKRWLCPNKLV